MSQLLVKKLDPEAHLPEKATQGDLGYDLFCATQTEISPGATQAIPTGVAVQFPNGWGAVVKDRSSMAVRQLSVGAGVIDNGYRGQILVVLTNHSSNSVVIEKGQKIAQMIPVPVTSWSVSEVESLDDSQRGEGGFGSTGHSRLSSG